MSQEIKQENAKAANDDKDPIAGEISAVLKAADGLISMLEKIAPKLQDNQIVNKEAFLKIVKPLCISVENSLPMLNDYADNLDYLKDEQALLLRRKITHLEDDLLPPLLAYLKESQS